MSGARIGTTRGTTRCRRGRIRKGRRGGSKASRGGAWRHHVKFSSARGEEQHTAGVFGMRIMGSGWRETPRISKKRELHAFRLTIVEPQRNWPLPRDPNARRSRSARVRSRPIDYPVQQPVSSFDASAYRRGGVRFGHTPEFRGVSKSSPGSCVTCVRPCVPRRSLAENLGGQEHPRPQGSGARPADRGCAQFSFAGSSGASPSCCPVLPRPRQRCDTVARHPEYASNSCAALARETRCAAAADDSVPARSARVEY